MRLILCVEKQKHHPTAHGKVSKEAKQDTSKEGKICRNELEGIQYGLGTTGQIDAMDRQQS